MKKRLCLIFIVSAVYSQKTDKRFAIELSQPNNLSVSNEFINGSEILVLQKQGQKNIELAKFDCGKMKTIVQNSIPSPYPDGADMEFNAQIGNRMFSFFSVFDKKNQIEQLFALELDFDNAKVIGESKKILSVKGKVENLSHMGRDYFKGKFLPFLSYDNKTFLIKYRPKDLDPNKNKDQVGLVIFDEGLNELSLRFLQMPYSLTRMDDLNYKLDRQGNIIVLAKVFHDDSEGRKRKSGDTSPLYHFEIMTLASGSDKVINKTIETQGKVLGSVKSFYTATGEVLASGFYSNAKGKEYEDNGDGIIGMKVNADGSVYNSFSMPFPDDFVNLYETENTRTTNRKKLENGEFPSVDHLVLKQADFHSDGSFTLAGEQDFGYTNAPIKDKGDVRNMGGFIGDMIAVRVNADGKVDWVKKVPKSQFLQHAMTNTSSFRMFENSGNDYIIFLDNIKNSSILENQAPVDHQVGSGGYLTSVKIDKTGGITKTSLFDTRNLEGKNVEMLDMQRFVQINNNAFVFDGYDPKTKENLIVKVMLD